MKARTLGRAFFYSSLASLRISCVPDAVQHEVMHRRAGTQSCRQRIQLIRQIAPIRIELFDQLELPCAPPPLQRMFARPCVEHRIKGFEIDEEGHAILPREARYEFGLVLAYSANEVVRHSDVESAVSFARKDVNVEGHVRATSAR